jgi:hypothetical protein
MRRLEALGIVQRRKADALQRFELLRVVAARLHDHQAVWKASVVPHDIVPLKASRRYPRR